MKQIIKFRGFEIEPTRHKTPAGWRYGYIARRKLGVSVLTSRMVYLSKKSAIEAGKRQVVYALEKIYPHDAVAQQIGWPPKRSIA